MTRVRWKLKNADAANKPLDAEQATAALEILADFSAGIELRVFPSSRSFVAPGGDTAALVEFAKEANRTGQSVFYCLGPVPADLKGAAKDHHVLRRRWLLIDVDPTKPKDHVDDSATDAEKAEAFGLANDVQAHLDGLGWPKPVVFDTGNGYHVLYRIDQPNTDLVRAAIKKALYALAAKFNRPGAVIDKVVHNASRLARLPGSWARKGADTPDRPWRMCKVVSIPASLHPVDFHQLTALGQGEPKNEPAPPTRPELPAADRIPADAFHPKAATASKAYAKAALDMEVGRICQSRSVADGGEGRNNQLNTSAFNLGQLIGGGELSEAEVWAALEYAGLQVGLDEAGVRATIASGISAGKLKPRKRPDETNGTNGVNGHVNGVNGHKAAEPKPEPERLTIRASNVESKRVDWFWKNRIAKNFLTLFCGRTAVGKSFVLCDLISRLSVGGEIPLGNGECFEVGNSLLISEDPYEYMIVPRLLEMGADLDRVHFMSLEAMMFYTLDKISWLEKAYQEAGCPKLVAIDPPTNFLGETDEHRNAEIRQMLMHLVKWVQAKDCVLILILHVNKQSGKGTEALSRVLGSVAWTTVSRIAHSFCVDPDDETQSLFVPMKNNLGPLAKGLTFSVVATKDDLAKVEWKGEVNTTANEGMAGEKAPPKKKRGVMAAEWLAEVIFKDVDRVPSNDIWDRKRAETDISDNGLKEAKSDLGIRAERVTDDDNKTVWWCHWPEDRRRKWELTQALKKQTAQADDDTVVFE